MTNTGESDGKAQGERNGNGLVFKPSTRSILVSSTFSKSSGIWMIRSIFCWDDALTIFPDVMFLNCTPGVTAFQIFRRVQDDTGDILRRHQIFFPV